MNNNPHSNINLLIDYFDQEEALRQFAVPSTTAVNGSIFDLEGDFAKNQPNLLANGVDSPEAFFQQNPAYDAEGNLKYKGGLGGGFLSPLDLIPGLGAIGKLKNTPSIIKQMMRGGQKAKDPFWINPKMLKKYRMQPSEAKYLDNVRSSNKIDDIVEYTAESKGAIQIEKALGKHKGTYSNPAYPKVKGGGRVADPNASSFEIVDDIPIEDKLYEWFEALIDLTKRN